MARLVFLVGASGVGKDTLLGAVRRRHPHRLVAHRYITRASNHGGENFVSLSGEEFAWRRQAGLFCLSWQAHALDYGIGIEVAHWLEQGETVLVNGSRRALTQARQRFGESLLPLLITADAAVLRQRLEQRGRESNDQIEARLARHRALEDDVAGLARVDNSGALDGAVAALDALLIEQDCA